MPPTPTMLAPVLSVPVQIPHITLWDSTSNAITIWQMFGSATAALQIALIVIVIFIFVRMASRWITNITRNEQ